MPTLPSTWPDSAARAISAERRHASASGATHAIITSSLIRNRPDFRKSRRRRSETRSRLLLRRGKQARRWLEVLNIHLWILLPHIWNDARHGRSEEHTSELQSLMRISYAVFCLKKKKT